MTSLIELAERVEKATGPDRELDLAIINGITSKPGWFWHDKVAGIISRDDYGANALGNPLCSLETFTGSIDAAMTLVPAESLHVADRHWQINTLRGTTMPEGGFHAAVYVSGAWVHARGATASNALSAAALRARAATPIAHGGGASTHNSTGEAS